tara:strand:- start:954 stop:1094 length:141 start_codon:yes stop_codon:yes gene_type:complete
MNWEDSLNIADIQGIVNVCIRNFTTEKILKLINKNLIYKLKLTDFL